MFLLSGVNETRWSDVLAALIEGDPGPIARFIGTEPDAVEREVVLRGEAGGRNSDRLDLVLKRGEHVVGVVEVKVLSDVGIDQLQRYERAFPGAGGRYVLTLSEFPPSTRAPWIELTWQEVLTAYAGSSDPWVAATARGWLEHLVDLVPAVNATTGWNDLRREEAAAFELDLRTRVAWLASRMHAWCTMEHDLTMSSGGGAWVAAMRTPVTSDHWLFAEVQEGMPAQEWAPNDRPYAARVRGPVILAGLTQRGPRTSESFDWRLLHQLFKGRVYDQQGAPLGPWQQTRARLRDSNDRAGWEQIIAAGAPPWLGKGYGMATARTHGFCAFGVRKQLSPSLTLGQVDDEMRAMHALLVSMSGSGRRA